MILKCISEILDCSVIGNGNRNITSVRFPEEADDGSLVYIVKKRNEEYNGHGVLISSPSLFDDKYDHLVSYIGEQALAVKCAELLASKGELPDYRRVPQYRLLRDGVYAGKNVCIGENTVIEPFAVIGDNVSIGSGCYIGSGVHIGSGCVIGDMVRIGSGSKICSNAVFYFKDDEHIRIFAGVGKVAVGNECTIGCNTVIQRGTFSDTIIGEHTNIGDLVDIGHDVKIGADCRITSQSGISGGAVIEDCVCILGQSGIAEYVRIGNNVLIKGKSGITKDIRPYDIVSGNYGRSDKEELRFQAYLRKRFKERNSD